MKRFFSIFLILSIIMSLCSFGIVYADNISYFNLCDFEKDTVGGFPSGLLGYGSSLDSSSYTASNAEVMQDEETENKYLNVKTRVRALFSENISDGTIVLEFDANLGLGSLGLGVLYDNSLTTYAKWIFGWTRKPSAGVTELVSYKSTGAVPPGSHASRVDVIDEETNSNFEYVEEKWQHYKVWIDLDRQAVRMNISDDDNPKGNTSKWVEGISYIGAANRPLAAIAFYNGRGTAVSDPFLMDNLKVYREENKLTSLEFKSYTEEVTDGLDGIVPSMLDKATLKFSNPIDTTLIDSSISLYNNTTSLDEDISITWSTNKREVYIAPTKKYLDPNSSYTLTIADTLLDKYNQKLNAPEPLTFSTDEGGFNVSDIIVLKGETEDATEATNVAAGDVLTVKVVYFRSGDAVADDAHLAFCAKNESILCNAQVRKIVFDGVGKCEATATFTVPSDLTFNKSNIYLWDEKTRIPVLEGVSFGG